MISILQTKTILDFEKGPIRRSLFSNGAVSLFQSYPGMSSAVVKLFFLAGSIHEQEGQEGMVHMIEHMLFKEGKESHLVRDLEFQGAEINAFTYKEYVCFEMHCAAVKLEKFLPLFFHLFFTPAFRGEDLQLEKQVVIQELMDELDDHESWGHDYILQKCFGHDLGHSIGGTAKTVSKFQSKQLKQFFHKYFTADRMVLSISSGLKHPEIEKLLLESMLTVPHFQHKAKPVRYRPKDTFSSPVGFNRTIKRKIENSVYFLATGGPSINSKYYFDLAVMDEIFFEGLSSKFYQQLREKYGLLYGLGSVMNSFYQTGLYVMIFNGRAPMLKDIRKRVKELLGQVAQNGFDPQEVEAVKQRMIESTMRGFDDMEERNEYIAMREIYHQSQFSLESELENIRKVTAKRLKYLLNKMLQAGQVELSIIPKA